MPEQTITYRIQVHDATAEFELSLNEDDMTPLELPDPGQLPDWTQLEHHQCPNCPLDETEVPHCPLAAQLVPVIEQLGNLKSHTQVELAVDAGGRALRQSSTLQQSLGSIMGLVIATSGCPHTLFLKPMARFHQPLSQAMETVYRANAMYLMAQYLRHRKGLKAEFELDGLKRRYKHLQLVNAAIADRLRSVCTDDGAVNAVVLLDAFAKFQPLMTDSLLDQLEGVFAAYLKDA